MCLCAFLAFSATLSADPYTFMPGQGISGLSTYLGSGGNYDGVPVSEIGPYAGTLSTNPGGVVSPNYVFFCLTGSQYYANTETGNDGPANQAQVATGATNNTLTLGQQEEAAFLVSIAVYDEAKYGVSLNLNTVAGQSANHDYLTVTGTDVADFDKALGPIQLAIWYVTATLPSAITWSTSNINSITDSAVKSLVTLAQSAAPGWYDGSLKVFAYAQDSSGQNFISVNSPEPSTMVLFGAGGLLMALGCGRKLLAKRRSR
jgi:hypothetical protein